MKLKMIYLIILLPLALFFVVGLYNAKQLQHIHLQQEVTIDASRESVFDQVVYLKNFPSWSPFLEADPSQKIAVKGADGQIGAQYHWEGNKGKDLGYQEIKAIKPLEYVKMGCVIQKPFQAQPTFEYAFSTDGHQTSVIQDFKLQSGMVDAFFMWMFGAKKSIAKMNARGMALLKLASEG